MSAGVLPRLAVSVRPLLREQALLAAAQGLAGLGNLAFALLAARVLAPAGFGDLVAFLGLYLVLHVPLSSLSAGSALRPVLAGATRRRALLAGLAGGAVAAAIGVPLFGALGAAFAAAVPAAGLLALERGRLYGSARHGRVAATLLAEPAARLAAGLPLAAALGPAGAAAGVVLGGLAALAVAMGDTTRPTEAKGSPTVAVGEAWVAAAAFLGLAILQNQDVLLANAALAGDDAGRFAVLSTLGGVAAFATTTIPLVLLPRARDGVRGATAAALALAAALGAAAVLLVALVPVEEIFGDRYAGVGALVVPYVAAMALLGVVRVLVADASARGRGRPVAVVLLLVAAVQAAATITWGESPRAIALLTLAAMTTATAGAAVIRFPVQRRRPQLTRTGWAVLAMTAAALLVRVAFTRSVWLDEATSIAQAQMPLGQMLDTLRVTDVHPPLHHLTLWVLARLAGTGEYVMRAPSIAAGVALVPVLHALGRELFDRSAGLAAAALGALAPFALWYSQEARMYALFMLFAALAVLAQLRVLRTNAARDWLLYGAATAALVWTQYFGLLLVAVQQVAFLAALRGRRELLRGWLLTTVAIAAALAPLVPFAIDQFQANQSAGRGFGAPTQAGAGVDPAARLPGVYTVLTNVVWAVWGYHSAATMAAVTALWPLGILLALLLLGRGRSPRVALVAACAILPALALFGLGLAKPFLFEIRYFAGSVPLLLVLLAGAVTRWAPTRALAVAATVALAGTLGVAAADQQVNRSNPRLYDFQGALARIEDEVRPGDRVVFAPQYIAPVVGYYSASLGATPVEDGLPGKDARRVFVIASFLDKPAAREEVRAALTRLGRTRRVVERFRRPQVRVWVLR